MQTLQSLISGKLNGGLIEDFGNNVPSDRSSTHPAVLTMKGWTAELPESPRLLAPFIVKVASRRSLSLVSEFRLAATLR